MSRLDPELFRKFLLSVRERCVREHFGDENAGHPSMVEWLAEVRMIDTIVSAIDATEVPE